MRCDNRACPDYSETGVRNYTNCSVYNSKGVRRCERRLNPSGKPCSSCGRPAGGGLHGAKMVGGECQWCRGSMSRHRNVVRFLVAGGAPTLADIRRRRV